MERVLNWGTTPGMGDVMMGLNCAYNWAWKKQMPLTLNLHWWHDEKHKHHPEDPETIIERCDYIRHFYIKNDLVKVNHIIDSKETQYKNPKSRFDWFQPRNKRPGNMPANSWLFDPKFKLEVDNKKIVVWRATFNSETPRYWKRIITNSEWFDIITKYKKEGYNVIELCYRTPISEVMYHINTCNFIVCYDGMWHYIASNFLKPMLISSHDGITGYHTKHAAAFGRKLFLTYSHNLDIETNIRNKGEYLTPYEYMQIKSMKTEAEFWKWYNADR